MIVAIDGPAGAGKSTVAKALASKLGFSYLDTGAMYRCVALAALERFGERAAQPEREGALGPLATSLRIELGGAPPETPAAAAGEAAEGSLRAQRVLLDGRDVSELIRSREVSEMASQVAAVQAVRTALVAKQRELVAAGDWVAEGRDVGTKIAPEAQLKVFLDADPQERARRRAAELGADVQQVLAEQTIRDVRDAAREHSPLQAAPDSVRLDTTGLPAEQVVAKLAAMVAQRR